MPVTTPIEFGGRVVMVGCGSIGQAVLPLLRRHLALAADGLIVLAADEVGRGISQEQRAQFFYAHLKPRSFRRILARHLRRGDLLLNLSVAEPQRCRSVSAISQGRANDLPPAAPAITLAP